MLRGYLEMDRDGDGVYSWNELLPVIKKFYVSLWVMDRPSDAPSALAEKEAGGKQLLDEDGEKKKDDNVVDYGEGTLAGFRDARNALTGENAAKAGLQLKLPPHWHQITDPETGKVYYANEVTMETRWDIPT